MKCPICNSELDTMKGISDSVLGCPKCRHIATRGLWEALDVAIKHLNGIRGWDKNGNPQTGVISCWLDLDELSKALNQIKQIIENNDTKAV